MSFCYFQAFLGEIHRELLFLDIKESISEKSTKILRKFAFLTMFEKAKFWENLYLFKQLFLIKTLKGDNIKKTVFLNKVCHILLNYAFLLFWSILVEINREIFFLDIKVTISETRTEILRKLFFLTCLNWGNHEEIWDMFKQLFLIKPLKVDKF